MIHSGHTCMMDRPTLHTATVDLSRLTASGRPTCTMKMEAGSSVFEEDLDRVDGGIITGGGDNKGKNLHNYL